MAIDPKLVSITSASELPTGDPTSAGEFFFFEGNEMKKAPMTNIYDKVVGNFSGTLMIADTPTPTEPTWYFAGESGTYTNAGGLTISEGNLGILNYDGSSWNKVEVAPDLVINSFEKSSGGINIANPLYFKADTRLSSSGGTLTGGNYVGDGSVIGLPVSHLRGRYITISGAPYSEGRFIVFKKADGITNDGNVSTMSAESKSFLVTAEAETLSFTTNTSPNPYPTNLMVNIGEEALPYEPFSEAINELNGLTINASSLAVDNSVPPPINDKNAVNLGYLNKNAVAVSDLKITKSPNLASTIIDDQYISNSGAITNGLGWKMLKVDVGDITDGAPITFGNFQIQFGGYLAFHDVNLMLVSYEGSYGESDLPKTVYKPTGAKWLHIDIARPTGINIHDKIIVNEGDYLIEYVSTVDTVTEIKGFTIGSGGGGSSNVAKFSDLTDVPPYTGNEGKALRIKSDLSGLEAFEPMGQGGDASFNEITANVGNFTTLDLTDVPIWDEVAATSILAGQIYLKVDGANYQLKVKGV